MWHQNKTQKKIQTLVDTQLLRIQKKKEEKKERTNINPTKIKMRIEKKNKIWQKKKKNRIHTQIDTWVKNTWNQRRKINKKK